MNLKKNALTLAAAAALTLAAGASVAQSVKGDGSSALLSDRFGNTLAHGSVIEGAPPPTAAAVTLEPPEGNLQTFALAGDADNCVITVGGLPAGLEITGASWDVTIASIGDSWLNEAQFAFSTTDPGDPGITLTPSMTGAPGTEDISSGGIVSFAAAMIPNIPVGSDGEFSIEMIDSFDDNAGAADADLFNLPAGPGFGLTFACDDQAACDSAFQNAGSYTTSGSCAGFTFGSALPESLPVPTNAPWALALLMMVLAGFGIVAVRRFA
jgi:hypothetical protein